MRRTFACASRVDICMNALVRVLPSTVVAPNTTWSTGAGQLQAAAWCRPPASHPTWHASLPSFRSPPTLGGFFKPTVGRKPHRQSAVASDVLGASLGRRLPALLLQGAIKKQLGGKSKAMVAHGMARTKAGSVREPRGAATAATAAMAATAGRSERHRGSDSHFST